MKYLFKKQLKSCTLTLNLSENVEFLVSPSRAITLALLLPSLANATPYARRHATCKTHPTYKQNKLELYPGKKIHNKQQFILQHQHQNIWQSIKIMLTGTGIGKHLPDMLLEVTLLQKVNTLLHKVYTPWSAYQSHIPAKFHKDGIIGVLVSRTRDFIVTVKWIINFIKSPHKAWFRITGQDKTTAIPGLQVYSLEALTV